MMVKNTNALEILEKNLVRTEMLIRAMEKIKGYNQIYQNNQTNIRLLNIVKTQQESELKRIEQSCGEHAIISLITAFEIYYKELTQEMLANYPNRFLAPINIYSEKMGELIQSAEVFTYEDIEEKLGLKNHYQYFSFFKTYSIPFLQSDEEEFINYLYIRRNNYVHNAGRSEKKFIKQLSGVLQPFKYNEISTDAKRLRTRFTKILKKAHVRAITSLENV